MAVQIAVALEEVDSLHTQTQQMVVELSRRILRKNGFTVEAKASLAFQPPGSRRSGKPVIALGSDIDGLPQASQKPGVAYHDPLIVGAPGHGEGRDAARRRKE